jgi:organic hydroperoxide reductase OsmC/OhrA
MTSESATGAAQGKGAATEGAAEAHTFTIELEQERDYEFRVRFDWDGVPDLMLDEPAPLGRASGPNAARLIAAGVANCLSASLLFCMRKFKQDPGPIRARVTGRLTRNERGRMRIGGFDVEIRLPRAVEEIKFSERCLQQFEDFCIVTESVRNGIPVGVKVIDGAERTVFEG